MIAIRNAESPDEIAEAKQLFEEYAQSLGFGLCFQGFDKELAGLPGDYAPPHGRLLVAYIDEKLGGCVALHGLGPGAGGAGEIKRLFVRPEFRGRQIGKALMDAVLEAARSISYRRLLLDTVTGKMERRLPCIGYTDFVRFPATGLTQWRV